MNTRAGTAPNRQADYNSNEKFINQKIGFALDQVR